MAGSTFNYTARQREPELKPVKLYDVEDVGLNSKSTGLDWGLDNGPGPRYTTKGGSSAATAPVVGVEVAPLSKQAVTSQSGITKVNPKTDFKIAPAVFNPENSLGSYDALASVDGSRVLLNKEQASNYGFSSEGVYTAEQLNTAGNALTGATVRDNASAFSSGASGNYFKDGQWYNKELFGADRKVGMSELSFEQAKLTNKDLTAEQYAAAGGGKDNGGFLGMSEGAWGNVFKGGELLLNFAKFQDDKKTNALSRKAMRTNIDNANKNQTALDTYRAAYK